MYLLREGRRRNGNSYRIIRPTDRYDSGADLSPSLGSATVAPQRTPLASPSPAFASPRERQCTSLQRATTKVVCPKLLVSVLIPSSPSLVTDCLRNGNRPLLGASTSFDTLLRHFVMTLLAPVKWGGGGCTEEHGTSCKERCLAWPDDHRSLTSPHFKNPRTTQTCSVWQARRAAMRRVAVLAALAASSIAHGTPPLFAFTDAANQQPPSKHGPATHGPATHKPSMD